MKNPEFIRLLKASLSRTAMQEVQAEKVATYYKHEKNADNKRVAKSYLATVGKYDFIENETFDYIKAVIVSYNIALTAATKCWRTKYIDGSDLFIDAGNKQDGEDPSQTFDKEIYTKDALYARVYADGAFQPFYGFMNDAYVKIAGGRHRIQLLNSLKTHNYDRKFFCILLNETLPFNEAVTIPTPLYEEFLKRNTILATDLGNGFTEITTDSPADLYLIIKLHGREITYLLDHYYDSMIAHGVTPPNIINLQS